MTGAPLRLVGALIALAAVSPSPRAQAPSPAVRLHVLADSVSLGERFELAVAVDHAPGRSVLFPEVPAGSPEAAPLLALGDAEAFSVRRLPPAARGAVRTDSAVYQVAVFEAPTAVVGPLVARLVADGDTTALASGVADVPVRPELGGEASPQPAPPSPPFSFPSPLAVWLAAALAALVALAVATWLVRGALRGRRRSAPRLPAYAEATERLGAFADPPTDAAAPRRIVELSDVLRTFLGRRLGVPAHELTTAELDAALAADGRVPEPARRAARGALRVADLVKFADARPDAALAAETLAKVRDAVELTEGGARAAEQAAASDPPDAGSTDAVGSQ